MAITLAGQNGQGRVFGSSASYTHTVPAGANRFTIICVFSSTLGQDVTAITFGGTSILANVIWDDVNWGYNDARVHCFYVIGAGVGAKTMAYTLGGNCSHASVCVTWTGVDQATPYGTRVTAQGNSSTPSVTVSSAAARVVFDNMCFSSGDARTVTMGAGQTLIQKENSGGGTSMGYGCSYEPGAASNVMSWTLSWNEEYVSSAVELYPATDYDQAIWIMFERAQKFLQDLKLGVIPRDELIPRWKREMVFV